MELSFPLRHSTIGWKRATPIAPPGNREQRFSSLPSMTAGPVNDNTRDTEDERRRCGKAPADCALGGRNATTTTVVRAFLGLTALA